jgi:hypothetical protein
MFITSPGWAMSEKLKPSALITIPVAASSAILLTMKKIIKARNICLKEPV